MSHFLILFILYKVLLSPNYKWKTKPWTTKKKFHSGTNFSPVKIWQARPLWICLSICLFRAGGSLVPNQSLLQTESQSKTCTPGLWFSGTAWIFLFGNFICNFQNLTPPKFDSAAVSSSQHRARRRDSIGKQIWKARNTKPIISL